MEIRRMKLSDIRGADYNPRVTLKSGDPEFEKLRKSIKEFGAVEPLVWNKRTGNLVGGHQRLAVMCAEGVEEVEVSIVDLSLKREQLLNIALNKISGKFDESKLAALLDELGKVPDFDVSLTGFDKTEISGLFDRHLTPNLDAIEEIQESGGPPITKRGDLIHLGPHRLMCGDSTLPEDLKILLGNQKIDLWFSDFPYCVKYSSEQRPTNKRGSSKWKKIENDDLKPEEYKSFLEKSVRNLCPFLTSGAPAYLFNGFAKMACLQNCLEEEGFHASSLIVWVKPTPSPSFADYNWQSEYCLYGWKEGASHKWFGPPTETNVWESARDAANTLIHPTTKPIALAQRAMRNSSKRGDRVFDGFAGSGSTLVAAQSLERIGYVMELDPLYCDAIVRRYIKTFGPESISPEILKRYGREI